MEAVSAVSVDIKSAKFYPMNDYFATLTTNVNAPQWYEEFTGNFYYPGTMDFTGAEMGYLFRSSVRGKVISMGINLPNSGYNHRITIWDSVTSEALGSVIIQSVGSTWIYADLKAPVTIKANQSYIVTVNTAVKGIEINQYTPAETVFILDGIFVTGGFPLTFFPATDGPITIESPVWFPYGIDHPRPLFYPGSGIQGNVAAGGFQGFCDIGFDKD